MESFDSHNVSFNPGSTVGIVIQDPGNTFTISQSLNQLGGGFSKGGLGTVVLAGANSYSGTTGMYGGTLEVDASQGGSLSSSTPLFFDGGTFELKGSTGTTVQTVGNVTMGILNNTSEATSSGGTIMVNNNGGNTTLNLGTLPTTTLINGSELLLEATGSGTSVITSTTGPDGTGNTNGGGAGGGIYGGRIVYEDSSGNVNFATSNSTSGPYVITGLQDPSSPSYVSGNTYTEFNTLQGLPSGYAVGNYLLTDSDTSTFAFNTTPLTINSLKITTSLSSAGTLDMDGFAMTLTSGGLLYTGSQNYTIQNGTLLSGLVGSTLVVASGLDTGSAASRDLLLYQYGTGTLTINAVIGDVANTNTTLTVSGTGTLILTATNTYNGQTFLNGGTVQISSYGNLSGSNGIVSVTSSTSGSSTVTVASVPAGLGIGASFMGSFVKTIVGTTITLSGGANATISTATNVSYADAPSVMLNGGTLQVTSSVNFSETNGAVTQAGTFYIGGNGGTINVLNGSTVTIPALKSFVGGSNTGAEGSLTINSSDNSNGVVFLAYNGNNTGNTTAGSYILEGGILRVGGRVSNDNLNSVPIETITWTTASNARLQLNGKSTVVAGLLDSSTSAIVENGNASNTSVFLGVGNGETETFAGKLVNTMGTGTGTLGFMKFGAGLYNLTNTGSTYTGATVVDQGILNFASVSNGSFTPTVSTTSGLTTATLSSTAGLVNGNTYTIYSANVTGGTTFTYGGTASITLSSAALATASGTATTIGLPSALGEATNVASNLVFGGGTLQYTGSTAQTTDRLFTLGDGGNNLSASTNVGSNNGTIDASGTGSGTLTFSNAGAIAFAVNSFAHSLTLTGTNTGANTLAALISDPTYTTTFTGTSGTNTVTVGSTTGLAVNETLTGTGIAPGAVVESINGSVVTLSANNTGTVSGSGALHGLPTSLIKSGVGSWQVTNANTYSGGTSITGGTLYANNTTGSATGSGAVGVASGGTLAGSGFIVATTTTGTNAVTVASGGNITPGGVQSTVPYAGTPGTTASGNLTLDPTNVTGTSQLLNAAASPNGTTPGLTFALGAGNASSGSKIIVAGSAVNVMNFNVGGTSGTSTVVSINDLVGASLTLNQNYILIQGNGSTTYEDNGQVLAIGNLDNLVAANGLILGGLQLLTANTPGNFFSNWYSGSQLYLVGDDIEVEVVPEPGTWAMMLSGLALLLVLQRRKRKLS